MTRRRMLLAWAGAAVIAFTAAAAFSAYLRPGMLTEFANLILCY